MNPHQLTTPRPHHLGVPILPFEDQRRGRGNHALRAKNAGAAGRALRHLLGWLTALGSLDRFRRTRRRSPDGMRSSSCPAAIGGSLLTAIAAMEPATQPGEQAAAVFFLAAASSCRRWSRSMAATRRACIATILLAMEPTPQPGEQAAAATRVPTGITAGGITTTRPGHRCRSGIDRVWHRLGGRRRGSRLSGQPGRRYQQESSIHS